ncbi:MAG: hypothetical protein WC894_02650 [Patescibacteria group bacterium]
MKVSQNVRPKPSLPLVFRRIPFLHTLFHGTAQGIYPYIFIPKEIYKNLMSKNPNLYHVSLIVHEQTHLDRQREHGLILWIVKYLLNSKFRVMEELIANKYQMRYMKDHRLEFPFEKKAKMLSSWIYFWPVTYKEALKELKTAWNIT